MIKKYEAQEASKYFRKFKIIIPVVQSLTLLFFTLIGIFEESSSETILTDAKGIIVLSSTLTLSVFTVYTTFLLNKNVLFLYIGKHRERMYLFPKGRTEIFQNKIRIPSFKYSVIFFFSLCTVNIIYYFFKDGINKVLEVINVLNLSLLSALVSVLIILLSMTIGFKRQSTNISLIMSVIIVVIIGNIVAYSYILPLIIILIINVCVFLGIYLVFKLISSLVLNDDVME